MKERVNIVNNEVLILKPCSLGWSRAMTLQKEMGVFHGLNKAIEGATKSISSFGDALGMAGFSELCKSGEKYTESGFLRRGNYWMPDMPRQNEKKLLFKKGSYQNNYKGR